MFVVDIQVCTIVMKKLCCLENGNAFQPMLRPLAAVSHTSHLPSSLAADACGDNNSKFFYYKPNWKSVKRPFTHVHPTQLHI